MVSRTGAGTVGGLSVSRPSGYSHVAQRVLCAHWVGDSPVETVKVIRPNHVSGLSRITVLQCRKRCTGQQKGLPFVSFQPSEKAFLFRFAAEAGTYVTTTTRSRNSETADEL